jgi:hypothetical protein
MTMVIAAHGRVKEQLDRRLDADWIHRWLAAAGHLFRLRALSPARTIHLWIVQLLAGVSLEGLKHHDTQVPSAPALCQARQALPLALFHVALEHLAATLTPMALAGGELFHGFQIVLLDATSLRTWDTPELARHYGKHQNGHKIKPGYPAPKFLCLMDYATGLIRRAIDLPADRQEHMLLRRIAACLTTGQLLVADRGLVSFPFLCELLESRAHACIRLPAKLIARPDSKGLRSLLAKLGEGDWQVAWKKSPQATKAYSDRAYALLPGVLTLRQISRTIERKGFRTWTLHLVTTLVDAEKYPADEFVELYLKRWQVEVYFRDFKCSQNASMLRSRSLQMVRKELLVHVMLFNLVRSLMGQLAVRLKVEAHRISFRDLLTWLFAGHTPLEEYRPVINPHRKRPGHPRRVKTRRGKFPPLNQPRRDYMLSQLQNVTDVPS